MLTFDTPKYIFNQKIPFENLIFLNYLYPFMPIYINRLTQQQNLPNAFASTDHPKSYPLAAKLKPLSAT